MANRQVAGIWETFSLVPLQGGAPAHGSLVAIQVFNGQFWCAENGGGGALLANRAHHREWETFTVERVAGPGPVATGDQVAFRTGNGNYLCAESGGGRELVANRTVRSIWETFTVRALAPRHVRIELDSARCRDTEDVTGADEFFALGAGADRLSGVSCAVLSKPFRLNNGQVKQFPAAANERVVFDGTVDAASTIAIGLKFYDEDANHDWSKHGPMITALTTKVAAGLALIPSYGTVAGAVLTTVTQGIGLIMSLDKDDLLANVALELPVADLPMGTSFRSIPVKGGSNSWSNWNYLVQLRVTVN